MVVFVVQCIDRCSYICVYLALLLLCTRLSSVTQLHVYLIKRPRPFRFENPMDRVVRFWAKIWFGPSDSQIIFHPIGFCNIRLHKKTDPFIRSKRKNLTLGIGSRIRICLILMSQCGGTGLMSYRSYRSVRYRVDVVTNLPKCPVPVSMLYRYRYQLRYRRPYRYRRCRY